MCVCVWGGGGGYVMAFSWPPISNRVNHYKLRTKALTKYSNKKSRK